MTLIVSAARLNWMFQTGSRLNLLVIDMTQETELPFADELNTAGNPRVRFPHWCGLLIHPCGFFMRCGRDERRGFHAQRGRAGICAPALIAHRRIQNSTAPLARC